MPAFSPKLKLLFQLCVCLWAVSKHTVIKSMNNTARMIANLRYWLPNI